MNGETCDTLSNSNQQCCLNCANYNKYNGICKLDANYANWFEWCSNYLELWFCELTD